MKKGFYYKNTIDWIRCYYLSGEKSNNQWISIFEYESVPSPEWWSLNWMNIPKSEELNGYEYFEKNPTQFEIKI